jgi:creatinine amidohydrolase
MLDTKAFSRSKGVGFQLHELTPETSMMLYIDPTSVEMAKAVNDYHPAPGPLRRKRGRRGAYSQTGVYGDATLATAEKGRKVIDLLIEAVIKDIEKLRHTRIQYLR